VDCELYISKEPISGIMYIIFLHGLRKSRKDSRFPGPKSKVGPVEYVITISCGFCWCSGIVSAWRGLGKERGSNYRTDTWTILCLEATFSVLEFVLTFPLVISGVQHSTGSIQKQHFKTHEDQCQACIFRINIIAARRIWRMLAILWSICASVEASNRLSSITI
jgi:hypothetical protein